MASKKIAKKAVGSKAGKIAKNKKNTKKSPKHLKAKKNAKADKSQPDAPEPKNALFDDKDADAWDDPKKERKILEDDSELEFDYEKDSGYYSDFDPQDDDEESNYS